MAAADNLDISAASDRTSYGVTPVPYDDQWSDGLVAKTTMIQEDSCHCPSTCTTEHCGFISYDRCLVESNSSSLSSNRLPLDNSGSSSGHDAVLTVTEPYCWMSTGVADITACTSSVSCSELTSSLTDDIPHPVSSVAAVENDLFPATNGIHIVLFGPIP